MQNTKQLNYSIDSLENKLVKEYESFSENFYKRTGVFNFKQDIIDHLRRIVLI